MLPKHQDSDTSFFSYSDDLQIVILLKPTGNDLFDIANDNTVLLVGSNDLSNITYNNILMSLGNTKLTIIGLKDIIDSTTIVYIYISFK